MSPVRRAPRHPALGRRSTRPRGRSRPIPDHRERERRQLLRRSDGWYSFARRRRTVNTISMTRGAARTSDATTTAIAPPRAANPSGRRAPFPQPHPRAPSASKPVAAASAAALLARRAATAAAAVSHGSAACDAISGGSSRSTPHQVIDVARSARAESPGARPARARPDRRVESILGVRLAPVATLRTRPRRPGRSSCTGTPRGPATTTPGKVRTHREGEQRRRRSRPRAQ